MKTGISASRRRTGRGRPHDYLTKKVIVSTGYYDLANHLGIPGEDLPKVSHYYGEPHPYYDTEVLVIGGKNSAAICAPCGGTERGSRWCTARRNCTVT